MQLSCMYIYHKDAHSQFLFRLDPKGFEPGPFAPWCTPSKYQPERPRPWHSLEYLYVCWNLSFTSKPVYFDASWS